MRMGRITLLTTGVLGMAAIRTGAKALGVTALVIALVTGARLAAASDGGPPSTSPPAPRAIE